MKTEKKKRVLKRKVLKAIIILQFIIIFILAFICIKKTIDINNYKGCVNDGIYYKYCERAFN